MSLSSIDGKELLEKIELVESHKETSKIKLKEHGITTVQRAVVNKEQQKDGKNDVKGKTYELLVEG
ncbi:hypothetical protein KY290_019178 [Solanum tuberosum]|uniref:Uncharacterized protein n=1 Tax=Solanum tuberosum TaxID=4113 RepID=A0ABQ7VJA6_SOLTU|nr:hypothetical protein KY290_019178 [Solanum tuberosum]